MLVVFNFISSDWIYGYEAFVNVEIHKWTVLPNHKLTSEKMTV